MFERKAFYSPLEVAQLASLSTSTILNYIRAGKLYAVRLSERTYRIPLGAVISTFFPEQKRPSVIIRGSDGAAVLGRWRREWRKEHERPEARPVVRKGPKAKGGKAKRRRTAVRA